MMSFSSCLADADGDLILDASVFINLSASGAGAQVLHALPNRIFMVDVAASEVREDSRNGRSDGDTLQELVGPPVLEIIKLDEHDLARFERFVLALDDGEAATIAAATGRVAIPILDERRARKICTEEYPAIPLASTVDLLSHPAVEAAFGKDNLAEAVHAALRNARMHVRADQRDWIVDLIGSERAAGCTSIPRLRSAKIAD
jgi:predicted nucleic acid-binding protein